MKKEKIYDGIGREIGYLEEKKREEALIYFHDKLFGSVLEQEFYNLDGWYMGKWMGKPALGKVFDLGMERHGYMIANTEKNDRETPIDVGKFLLRNRENLLIGSADSPIAGAALALFYYREELALAHPDFEKRKVQVTDYAHDSISVNATQDFLATRHESILEEMAHQQNIFTSWLEFFLSEFKNESLIQAVNNYKEKMKIILESITNRFTEIKEKHPQLITEQMRRFLTSSFYYIASWDHVREALNQRLIPKYRPFHALADRIISDCKELFFAKAREQNIPLMDPFRTEIFSGFYMDSSEAIGINTSSSPIAIMGIPFEEMDVPWNWMKIGFQLGLEIYHNVRGLSEELKIALYEFLYGNFQDEVKVHWYPWRHYLFADIFSILLFGPTMVIYFADNHFQEMLDLQIEFNREKNIWEQEPLEYLRFLVQCTLLKRLGFGAIARELEAKIFPIAINPDYIIVDGNNIEMERFLDPAKQSISLILNSKFKCLNNLHLTKFISFQPQDEKEVNDLKDRVVNDEWDNEWNWRFLLPACYLAISKGYPKNEMWELIWKKCKNLRRR
ncbi:hypothetical protein ACFL35_02785 [Candidatus Riflebacteria bacterium]